MSLHHCDCLDRLLHGAGDSSPRRDSRRQRICPEPGFSLPQIVGTDIRVYNPAEKQWHMAWIDKTYRRLAAFTATHEDGKATMTGHNARGRLIRNTFSNMTAQAFDWLQE